MEKNRILRTGLWATMGAGLLAGYGIPASVNCAEAAPKAKPAATPKTFDGNIAPDPIPLAGGENVLYTINKDGDLLWRKHIMKVGMIAVPGTTTRKRGIVHSMTVPKKIGNGWGMKQVVPGGQQTIYGVTDDGQLRWFRHDGYETGAYNWAQDTVVGKKWDSFRKVIGMGNGVLYAWGPNAELRWYKHDDYTTGEGGDTNWAMHVVGKRWNYEDLFAGGNGVIYAVTADGKLMWYRHKNYSKAVYVVEDNPQLWQQWWDGPKQIGTGWDQFTNIFSPGNGEIYAIKPTGELMYYQHLGWKNGAARWGENAVVAKGWGDYAFAFARVKTGDPSK